MARKGDQPNRKGAPGAKRPKMPRKEMDRLCKAAWDAGCVCERTRKNYVKVYALGGRIVMLPSTPSGRDTPNAKERALNRAGIPTE